MTLVDIMSSVEKRHVSHRSGSMLHHRFPNGFTDLFMDETDREVSTLTDRAFRSLCVGDDAVYNDELLYGYSPFNCHKPLAGEPLKKTHNKESKKQGQKKCDKKDAQPWKQQQQNKISNMTSFLKALSATEGSCEGMLIKNVNQTDSNGESWDKSALRSIQRELSEFSTDYHANLTGGHYKNNNHPDGGSSSKTGKDAALPSGKSSKVKNGKTTVKLRKLNIKNFFLHSELSPFQTWRDFNQFSFGQKETVTSILPTDNIPKWYDLPFYKELTDAHRKQTLQTVEAQSCQKAAAPPPPTAPKPVPPPPPPKVLPKPSATQPEKRCSSEVEDGTAAPWRRNRSRAKSAIPVNQPGIPSQDNNLKTVDESHSLVKKEPVSVEVKAIEEVSSLASTPFSICQLMTPLIPSRQPTDTSEILSVLSPSVLDLPLRPHSEAKVTPEPPVKRDSYKSLASSILFNLKDNRKRVKSRYSPPKFKTKEIPDGEVQSPQSDHSKHPHACSDGNASGLSTPATFKDTVQTVCSPILECKNSPTDGLTNSDTTRPLSDDFLLSNLLQTKGEDNLLSPFTRSKKNKSPIGKKQNYPSLNLYKKSYPVDNDMKYVPESSGAPVHTDQPTVTDVLSPLMLNEELSPTALPTNTRPLPNTSNVSKDLSPLISPHAIENERLSSNLSVGKRLTNISDKAKELVTDTKEIDSGVQPAFKEKESSGQTRNTMDLIRAAREAINAVKHKALSVTQPESNDKSISDIEEMKDRGVDEEVACSKEKFSNKGEGSLVENKVFSQSQSESTGTMPVGQNLVKKEPPPVPKRHFAKSDVEFAFEKHQTQNVDKPITCNSVDAQLNLPEKEKESVSKQMKSKHIFSARQNNYIKNQRCAVTDDDQVQEYEELDLNVRTRSEIDENTMPVKQVKDSEHIMNDLHALKELQRAKLGDRILDNARNKFGIINIDEESRAKNDLISRELRNIKKGMLSMRGNTSAKRDVFAKTEKEQRKQEGFAKIDNNVVVNKALINDNYDKAKMALEEIITEREKRRNKLPEDDKSTFENASDECYVTRRQQSKNSVNDSTMEGKESQNGSVSAVKEKELKERLSDLRDCNHVRQILSQTEPRYGETPRLGSRKARARNELESLPKTKNAIDNLSYESELVNFRHAVRQVSEDSGESLSNETGSTKIDAPPVPPRIKKAENRTDDRITEQINISNDAVDEDALDEVVKYGNGELCLSEIRTGSGKQEEASDQFMRETLSLQNEQLSDKETWDGVNKPNSKSVKATHAVKCEPISSSNDLQSENSMHLSPRFKGDDSEPTILQTASAKGETVFENSNTKSQETRTVKRKAPLRPDHLLIAPDGKVTKNIAAEDESNKMYRRTEEVNVEAEAVSEIPRNIISPLLLVNGISVNQSPPDQASLSSKSSYFSADSALHRNTETESNIYHSLENLIGEVEEEMENVSQNTNHDLDRTEVEYYSLSDHDNKSEVMKRAIKVLQKEAEVDSNIGDKITADDEKTPFSPSNTFSPTLAVPSLFKVKDNTFNVKSKKTLQPWVPRSSLSSLERGDQAKEAPEVTLVNDTTTSVSLSPAETLTPKLMVTNHSPPLMLSPSNLLDDIPKKPQPGQFLSVQQEEDRLSGVSPSSEGVDSVTIGAAEMGTSAGGPGERDASKVPSEGSGSTYSGNESQTGVPKPPVVLPKSEKAVLKAMKLTNRRMRKEEAQKSPHKPSQSSSKHRAERHKGDKSEQKSSSSSSSKNCKGIERKHQHQRHDHHGRTNREGSDHLPSEKRAHNSESHHRDRTETNHNATRQSHKSAESNKQSKEAPPSVATERQGRSSDRHIRDSASTRHYSTDRVISNVPVYKSHISPMSDRTLQRSQSIDRYMGDKVERRFSADMSANERFDPRTQRIEKSIIDGIQQRGRARDKASRDNPLRRSQSIDAYSTEASQPPALSRQSSHTSQLSRQSSIEHAIVAQSFPMTQRKLLQDPDSGQYFFVDMPIQIKTKTFFDPETGSYVQLPVQPPEGAIPQASPMEVLTPPLVVYHSFVPVPLSPMAQKATIQTAVLEPEELEQRCLERSRPMHCKEGHPYLEPVYGQHDHVLGEFMGTEELDCPS